MTQRQVEFDNEVVMAILLMLLRTRALSDILHDRILWQVLLGGAALVCFATALSWIRAGLWNHEGRSSTFYAALLDVHVDGYLPG